MRKIGKRILICTLISSFVWLWGVLQDRESLQQELIRMHVVANSDTEWDQSVKLQVRDAVLNSIEQDLKAIADVDQAKAYLQENLEKIQRTANQTLAYLGCDAEATVSLCAEHFDTRHYETFSLPAGIYDALKIVIGSGEGKNWWCVAFPTLCIGTTVEAFSQTCREAGLSRSLSETLQRDTDYEIRFYCLDLLGRMERFWQERTAGKNE